MKLPRYEVYEYRSLHEALLALPAKVERSNAHRVVVEIPQKRIVLFSTTLPPADDELTLLDFVRERPLVHLPFEHSLLRMVRDVCDSLPEGEFPYALVCGDSDWFASTRFPSPTSLFGIPLVVDPSMDAQTVMVVISNIPFALKGICRSVLFSLPPLPDDETPDESP